MLDSTKDFFTKRIAKHCNKLPKEVVESPPQEVFKRFIDVELSDMFQW